jgi:endoglucanase
MSAREITRRGWLKGAGTAAALAVMSGGRQVEARPRSRLLRGINLAGAEFGESHMPGTFGTHYTYPDAATFARFNSYGFDCVRLPIRWERLQPDIDAAFDEAEWGRLGGAVRAARQHDQTIIIDVHNSARRRVRADGFAAEHMIGSALVPLDALARFWAQLARMTLSDAHVVHGIMNEPADIEPRVWLEIANRTIAAIRGAGAGQLILAPGVDWTGAHSWFSSGNTLMQRLVDTKRNMAIEVHQYLDTDSSGRSGRSVSPTIGSERLEAFQEWAREHRFKAFLGEFGAGADPTSVAALTDMLIEVERNPDVWIGWAAWAAGPWWPPDEPLRLEPDAGGILPAQTRAMMRFTQAERVPDDVIEGSAIDLDLARGRHHGVATLADALTVRRDAAGHALERSGNLASFDANEPRRTDLGLAIEAATRNALLGVEPVGGRAGEPSRSAVARKSGSSPAPLQQGSYLLGSPGAVARWQPRGEQAAALRRDAAGSAIAFGVHVLSDPLLPVSLTLRIGNSEAEIELAKRTAAMKMGHGAVSISGSGRWRRVSLALPGEAVPADAAVLLRRSAAPSAEVAIAAPMLGAATVSGMWVQSTRARDDVLLGRPIVDLLNQQAFTLMIETRSLCSLPVDLPLLAASAGVLLQRRSDGALASPSLGNAATQSIGAHSWEQRRRSVVALDRRTGRSTLATTGQPPVTTTAAWPVADQGDLMVGGQHSAAVRLDGLVTRLAILPRALDAAAAALLAGQ